MCPSAKRKCGSSGPLVCGRARECGPFLIKYFDMESFLAALFWSIIHKFCLNAFLIRLLLKRALLFSLSIHRAFLPSKLKRISSSPDDNVLSDGGRCFSFVVLPRTHLRDYPTFKCYSNNNYVSLWNRTTNLAACVGQIIVHGGASDTTRWFRWLSS